MTQPQPSLTLLDLSDRELLLIVRDVADGQGFALATDVAERLDLRGDHPHRSVSVRLSWLKRYGAVDREYERDHLGQIREHRDGRPIHTQRWKLTDLGLAIATGRLSKTTEKTLEKMDSGALLMTTRWLSKRISSANGQAGKLLDREYRHGVGRR